MLKPFELSSLKVLIDPHWNMLHHSTSVVEASRTITMLETFSDSKLQNLQNIDVEITPCFNSTKQPCTMPECRWQQLDGCSVNWNANSDWISRSPDLSVCDFFIGIFEEPRLKYSLWNHPQSQCFSIHNVIKYHVPPINLKTMISFFNLGFTFFVS